MILTIPFCRNPANKTLNRHPDSRLITLSCMPDVFKCWCNQHIVNRVFVLILVQSSAISAGARPILEQVNEIHSSPLKLPLNNVTDQLKCLMTVPNSLKLFITLMVIPFPLTMHSNHHSVPFLSLIPFLTETPAIKVLKRHPDSRLVACHAFV